MQYPENSGVLDWAFPSAGLMLNCWVEEYGSTPARAKALFSTSQYHTHLPRQPPLHPNPDPCTLTPSSTVISSSQYLLALSAIYFYLFLLISTHSYSFLLFLLISLFPRISIYFHFSFSPFLNLSLK